MVGLLLKLRELVGEAGVLTGDALAQRTHGFWDGQSIQAQALVLPRGTEEVAAILRLCNEQRQAIIPIGGLTNLVGATTGEGHEILLSLARMQAVEALDTAGRCLTVQAGATLDTAQQAAAAADLMVPVDFGARGSCTIGGMIATNAGGNRVLKYGMTRDMVLGLEAVLADGSVIGRLSGLTKDNTGYPLHQWLIGSEGTLAIVTRAVLRLHPQPQQRHTALLALNDFSDVLHVLDFLQRAGGGMLSAFELMWDAFYRLNTDPDAGCRPVLPHGYRYYALVEVDSFDASGRERFDALIEHIWDRNWIADGAIASSERERKDMWDIREGSEAERRRYAATECFDVSLALTAMTDYVERITQRLAALGQVLHVFGHVGDGNLHLLVGYQQDALAHPAAQRQSAEIIYGELAAVQGSISAEHGIGTHKKAWLHFSRSKADVDAMRAVKHALDPHGILNPDKIFDTVTDAIAPAHQINVAP